MIRTNVRSGLITSLRSNVLGVPSVGAALPDWPAWNGSTDGSANFFFTTNGLAGPTSCAFSSRNEFVAIIRDRGSPNRRLVNVYSLASDDTITEESSLALSANASGTFPDIIKMTDSRYLAIFSSGSVMRVYLLSKSGTTLAELAVDSSISGENQSSLGRLTDTTAVMFFDTTRFRSVIIDISGDTISFGSEVEAISTTSSEFSGLTVISPTEFVVAVKDAVLWYSVSGLVITLIDNLDIRVGSVNFQAMQLVKVRDDTVLLVFEFDSTTDNIFANTFTLTGSTISRGTEATVAAGTRWFGGPQGKNLVALDEGNFMLTAVHQDVDFRSRQTSISVDGSNVITVNNTVVVDGDHGTLAVVPEANNTKILIATQDDTTTPADQVRFQVLNGAS